MKASVFLYGLCISLFSSAQSNWPKEITAKNGAVITIYQSQPESMQGNIIKGRSAFSAVETAGAEPVFGVFWYTSTMVTDRDTRMVTLESITIDDVKLPGIEDTQKLEKLKILLEQEIPQWNLTSSVDDLSATIEQEQAIVSEDLRNDPPKIYFKTQPTTLVLIDGEPNLQDDKELKMKRVINSPFLIVENPDDKKFYLYGGQFWYASSSVIEGYQPVASLPKSIAALDEQLKKQQTEKTQQAEGGAPAILVSTTPAELIQSKGEANFANITDTYLLYVSNSEDDIFKNMNDQHYYVLLSGRWYSSLKLEGP
ncbi:MAG: hypothetical protein OEU76_02860, partial [Cyclobacteriaceae bacterium]|nr:hypothetical protein [Cyclobacteriaceae bacterium]